MEIKKGGHTHFEIVFGFVCDMVKDSVFPYAVPTRERVHENYFYPRTGNFLAYDGDIPVGFVSACVVPFFWSDYQRASDLGFYVKPDYRGSSAAPRLLRAIENWARSMGAKQFCMGQSLGGKVDAMRAFYERSGYQICGFNSVKEL